MSLPTMIILGQEKQKGKKYPVCALRAESLPPALQKAGKAAPVHAEQGTRIGRKKHSRLAFP